MGVRSSDEGAVRLTVEQLATLLDLALQRDEATFKGLARSLGVGARAADQLWTRTMARVAPASRRPRPKGRRP
ncbi:MAG: hypothetical protein HYV92_09890 [Candidatus Rokubacteria bacterium]|nr:hypothetical protein [Candidatus Rokubacteria bacterium]